MTTALGSAAIAAAIKSGNINIAGSMNVEVMDLSEASQNAQLQHAEKLRKFEAQQRARTVIVPTSIEDVKFQLRQLGHPVTLFGEGHADRRERLREIVAQLELDEVDAKTIQVYKFCIDILHYLFNFV
jgi:U4/U6 small nuclear ribonucleoprotein PRP4